MELEGETPWNHLGIVVGKIDPSSSKPEAHTTQILENWQACRPMNEESDEKPNSQISEDGAKREQPSTSLSLHGKWEWWGVGLSAFYNKSQVKRRYLSILH